MKKIVSALFIALVLVFAAGAHAASDPGPFDPQFPNPTDPGPDSPDTRGPIDPFPPPTFSVAFIPHVSVR